jgi:hypothetical protein
MEKQIALINKTNQRVINIIIVDSLDKSHIEQWATNEIDVVAVTDSIAYVHGLWDGKEFHAPDIEYLKSIGLVKEKEKVTAEEITALAE